MWEIQRTSGSWQGFGGLEPCARCAGFSMAEIGNRKERVPIFREMPFAFQSRNESEKQRHTLYREAIKKRETQKPQVLGRGLGDWSHAPAVRDSAWRKSETARSACAFAKRARLPQAEDSAPMRVSRIGVPNVSPAFPKIGEEKMNLLVESLKALLFGIVEGITEWLPISSTGHMILLDEFIQLQMSDAFKSMFEVVIQLGAILAVVLLYFSKLWPFKMPKKGEGFVGLFKMDTIMLWLKVVVAILPSAIVGIPFDDWMDAHLHNGPVVAAMLILYGVAFILVERRQNTHRRARIQNVELIDMRMALMIGLFQVLSLVPGTSRSGATILGGILMGCSRAAASEFSFFLAIPTMAGASLIKVLKFGLSFTSEELIILAIGCVSAFVVSIIAIKTFMGYIKRHSFTAFGWYRIILGAVVGVYFLLR